MYIDFSGLFHQSSKDRSGKGSVRIPLDQTLWPPEWKVIEYKEYPRLPKAQLPHAAPAGGFFDTVTKRRSSRDFTGRPVVPAELSAVLKYSCGILRTEKNVEHRAQPSGGGRFPIELYPLVFYGNETIPSGVYHYAVKEHALDSLWQRPFEKKDIADMFTYPWAQDATCALVLSAVFERNQMKYGERGYRQILIEAGTIVENIYLACAELRMKCCAIDGVQEPAIEKLLDIDGYAESVLCTVLIG